MTEIKDNIHGSLPIPADVALIINTPLFDRLNKVAQLGFLYVAYPRATHTRWMHSIGTYYLAQLMMEALKRNSQCTAILERADWLVHEEAVLVAALLHDVGHGPFSHTWEAATTEVYKHEEAGLACVDKIFNMLPSDVFPRLRANNNYGIELVKAIIVGERERIATLPKEFGFVFEIVNNKQCKVDVDKWDYLKRDRAALIGGQDGQDVTGEMGFEDVFLKARIADNGAHVEYRYEDYHKIYLLFETRFIFHRDYYRCVENIMRERIFAAMLQRCTAKLNGKRLADINPLDDEFLQLYDAQVLDLLRDDELYQYLDDAENLRAVNNTPLHRIINTIPGAGLVMPMDSSFYFYGDPRKKLPVTRDMETTTLIGYYGVSL